MEANSDVGGGSEATRQGSGHDSVGAHLLKVKAEGQDKWISQNTLTTTIKTDRVSELIFFGTGTSGCVPNVQCLTADTPSCPVCWDAFYSVNSRNKRRNTSLMIRSKDDDGKLRNILVDCGKTFYESALDWYPMYGLRRLDAVLLTHNHADAILGLDDLRQWTLNSSIQEVVDIYLSEATMDAVKNVFPYLVDVGQASGSGDVGRLRFNVIDVGSHVPPLDIYGLKVTPFKVQHGMFKGDPYLALGFRFENCAYISDASKLPDDSLAVLEGVDLCVLDALHYITHPSHFSVAQALDELKRLKPSIGLLTGFSHRVDHAKLEAELKEWTIDHPSKVSPAWDGLRIVMEPAASS